ncbi:hypothetical protein CU098_004878 [Rhizopus stolonifer]|uniref:Wilms tumor protein homolog n=1 Tax=Rhizopus stolonifer TaxID=4846 RepID=A0A367IY23_RHIST|nr:hypothetical protein CU098_004878 [Rhizopus stolonifer]
MTPSLPLLPPPQPTAPIDNCCEACCPDTVTMDVILPSIKRKRSISDDPSNLINRKKAQCKWSSCLASFDTFDDLTPHFYNTHLNHPIEETCSWESCSERLLDTSTQALINHLTSQHLQNALLHACRWINCTERFEGFDTLTLHLSQVHVGSGKSEYQCQWVACERQGKVFTQRQKIMRHIQTHTGAKPYQCQTCLKRFSESNMVVQHMRIHTGEKPFKCDQCSKDFSVSAALTIHKRVHTGEKPFACKFQACHKRFAESSNLTKHAKDHLNVQ